MKKKYGNAITAVIVILIGAVLVGGWVWNIVKLIGMTLDPITGLLIVRAIGIFIPPVGAVVGYF